MAELRFQIIDSNHRTVAEKSGLNEVNLFYAGEYNEGDRLVLETSEKNVYLWLQFDDALGKSLVYVTGQVTYPIPFGEKRFSLSPKAFSGTKHLLYARIAMDYEIASYRNLAVNVNDQHENTNCYPHASANVETRGETVFAAKNVIDGITANEGHGEWPYQSWGINMQEDAALKIEFGRKIIADRIVLYTRADFPHDNWWKRVTFTFSDGSSLEVDMQKSNYPHTFTFQKKIIDWVKINKLVKSEEESPFPALTQMEVYGLDIKC